MNEIPAFKKFYHGCRNIDAISYKETQNSRVIINSKRFIDVFMHGLRMKLCHEGAEPARDGK